jgi:hypothetical protein
MRAVKKKKRRDSDASPGNFTWHENEQNPNSVEDESYSSSVLEQQAYFFLADEADLEAPEAEAEWVTFTAKRKTASLIPHITLHPPADLAEPFAEACTNIF